MTNGTTASKREVFCTGSDRVYMCYTGCCLNGTTNTCCSFANSQDEDGYMPIYLGYGICVLFTIILAVIAYVTIKIYCYRKSSCFKYDDTACLSYICCIKQTTKTKHDFRAQNVSQQVSEAENNLTYTVVDPVIENPPPSYDDVVMDIPTNQPPPYNLIMQLPQTDMIYCHI